MKNLILLVLTFISLNSCKQDENNTDMVNLDRSFTILIKNSENEDLLDPEILETYNTDNIKIFYLENGKKIEYYKPNYDAPKGYTIDYSSGRYGITIFPNTNENDQYPITYIQWNEEDTDTIKCQFDRGDNFLICTKIWFNNEIVWNNERARLFEIIK